MAKLLAAPCAEDLVVGVTKPEPFEQPGDASFVQSFSAGVEDPPLLIQRIILAAPVSHLFTLGPCSHFGEAPLRDSHDVEPVSHLDGVIEPADHSTLVGVDQIGGHHPHALAPLDALLVEP